MKTRGLRIEDNKNNVVSVKLQDILKEIQNGDLFNWSILYFYGSGTLKDGKPIMVFDEEIRKAKKGLLLNWNELNELSNCFSDVWDIVIIGCKDEKLISRYTNYQTMYETCDIVIEMVDSSYWEIFSKDPDLINKLSLKFKDIKFLESDFVK
jgi:hypothetical protein